MRTFGAAFLAFCVLAGLLQPAIGQEACASGHGKLGVARTATIDAADGPHFGAHYINPPNGPSLAAQYKHRSLLADGEVILTFDDGPSRAHTRAILDALAAQCTKATFFMLGRMALAEPQLVKEVAQRGHTVATHTWSHANLQEQPDGKAREEIELGLSAVQQALGRPVAPFFRFARLRPTAFALGYVQDRRLASFGIDIDSRDFETKDAAAVHDRVMRQLASKRKGIILFHDIQASTARALPRLLEEIRAQGFRVVHVVPKAGAETLAEYDALARQDAERKRVAADRNPLSNRTITWPIGNVPEAKVLAKEPTPAWSPQDEDWAADFRHP